MKKKQKIRRFKLECDVYPYALFVITGGTKQQAIDWFDVKFKGRKDTIVEEDENLQGSMIHLDNELSHLIWFKDSKPGGAIVAHEALHSVCHVMKVLKMGALCENNEEAFAYLLMWTVKKIGNRVW